MNDGVESRILGIIVGKGRGWCFTSHDFAETGSDVSIRKALSNLEKKSLIRRLTQGVYEYPRTHKQLGTIPPDLHLVAETIAKKNGVHIQPTGALAANLAGFSEQVPSQLTYLTEGPSKKVKIGNQEICFKKVAKKVMLPAGTREGVLIQALKNLGKEHIDASARKQIRSFLKSSTEGEIRENLKFAPSWIRTTVFDVMGIDS